MEWQLTTSPTYVGCFTYAKEETARTVLYKSQVLCLLERAVLREHAAQSGVPYGGQVGLGCAQAPTGLAL